MADRGVDAAAKATAAFHVAIVEACGNEVLRETVQGFWDSRNGPLFARLGDYFETVASWRAAIAEHEAVLRRDPRARPRRPRAPRCTHHMDKSHSRFSASWRRANSFLTASSHFHPTTRRQIDDSKRFALKLIAACALAAGALAPLGLAQAQTKLKWAHVYETSEPFHK